MKKRFLPLGMATLGLIAYLNYTLVKSTSKDLSSIITTNTEQEQRPIIELAPLKIKEVPKVQFKSEIFKESLSPTCINSLPKKDLLSFDSKINNECIQKATEVGNSLSTPIKIRGTLNDICGETSFKPQEVSQCLEGMLERISYFTSIDYLNEDDLKKDIIENYLSNSNSMCPYFNKNSNNSTSNQNDYDESCFEEIQTRHSFFQKPMNSDDLLDYISSLDKNYTSLDFQNNFFNFKEIQNYFLPNLERKANLVFVLSQEKICVDNFSDDRSNYDDCFKKIDALAIQYSF